MTRAYHNTTARYNGFFNARELMNKNEGQLRNRHQDDYSQMLPLFVYPNEKQSQELYEEMDVVIEKCSEVIERHSIYLRRKEHVRWIDDCYFLIGKARFYKLEQGLAQESFLYVYQAFKDIPERYQGLNWLIKSYIETGNWEKAEEFLELGESEYRKIPEEHRGMFNAAYADFYLKKDRDYPKAIEKLEIAIKHTKEKFHLRRYTFVLAQLYQEQRQLSAAMSLYKAVIKMNPDYTMRFNAKINRAIAYDKTGGSSEEIKKELRKMLKDEKNEEFRDQIYYALAELALKEDDEPLAIKYLKKSTKHSRGNTKQKALSYLRLANIYFEQPNYVAAQAHYDSTLQYLPMSHPEYYEADSKNSSLQELVKNLKAVSHLDSLLELSNLSEKEQLKRVEKMISEIKAEEERQRLAALRELERKQAQAESSQGGGGVFGKGKWYFYNPTTMASGRTDFKRVWGERPLEDNWRRKSKSSGMNQMEGGATAQASGVAEESNEAEEKYDPKIYLANIPSTYQEQLSAHGELIEALFNVGTIFKESFQDQPRAIEAFKRITTTYDTSERNLPSHYQLYRIYLMEDNQEKAAIEKEWVLEHHPFSEYAYLIKNPNYNKESKETKEKIEEYYEATYRLYDYGLYEDVIETCNKADSVFKKNHIQAKFDYLRLKSIGYTSDKEAFKVALEQFVKDHPEGELKEKAEKILGFMDEKVEETPKAKYEAGPAKPHMFIMSFGENTKGLNELKNKVANFNTASFREKKLDFTTTQLPEREMFLIRTFPNQLEAMRYYKALQNNSSIMIDVEKKRGQLYVISIPNFRALFQNKEEESYMKFFQENYPL